MTNVQVQVLTNASGLSPVEVECFVTIPLEIQLTGLPGLAEIRSLSKFALSQITVVFRDDVDVYFARQLVLERLLEVRERLPAGIEPMMAPVTTGLGEVYQDYLEGPARGDDPAAQEAQLTDLRTIQDWVIRPLLKGVPGVIDVNALGGFVKQYQVLVETRRGSGSTTSPCARSSLRWRTTTPTRAATFWIGTPRRPSSGASAWSGTRRTSRPSS